MYCHSYSVNLYVWEMVGVGFNSQYTHLHREFDHLAMRSLTSSEHCKQQEMAAARTLRIRRDCKR